MRMEECPIKEICITQDRKNPHVKTVCDTAEYMHCVIFIGEDHPEKDGIEWNRRKSWIREQVAERNKMIGGKAS